MKVPVIQYNHDKPLVPTVERYSHCRLLLQRDILALHNGEAKARYNTLQAFSKRLLSEAWLTKILAMSYEGLYIAKGGVALDIPLCDYSSTLMTLHLLYYCYIQLSTLELPLNKMLHTICTCTLLSPGLNLRLKEGNARVTTNHA